MIDWTAVLTGTLAAAVWLLYVLVAARRIIREHRWPFFIPAACVEAWQQAPGHGAIWAGTSIVLLLIAAFTVVPLALGTVCLLLAQAVLEAAA